MLLSIEKAINEVMLRRFFLIMTVNEGLVSQLSWRLAGWLGLSLAILIYRAQIMKMTNRSRKW